MCSLSVNLYFNDVCLRLKELTRLFQEAPSIGRIIRGEIALYLQEPRDRGAVLLKDEYLSLKDRVTDLTQEWTIDNMHSVTSFFLKRVILANLDDSYLESEKMAVCEQMLSLIDQESPDLGRGISFFPELFNGLPRSQRFEMMSKLYKIPAEERGKFCSQIRSLPIACALTYGKLGVMMNELSSVRAEERAEFCAQVLTLVDDVGDKFLVTDVMVKLRELPAGERAEFCSKVKKLAFDLPYADKRLQIMACLRLVDAEERAEFFSQVCSLLRGGEDKSCLVQMMSKLRVLPARERAAFCSQVSTLPIGDALRYWRLGVMSELISLCAEDRGEFLSQVLTLLEGVENKSQVVQMMYVLQKLPAEERSRFCSQVTTLPIGNALTQGRLGVMYELLCVPATERGKFFPQVLTVLEGVKDESQVTELMYQLRRLSFEKRKSICDFISSMPKEMDREIDVRKQFVAINLLGELTHEERVELLLYCVARPSLKIFELQPDLTGELTTWVDWFLRARGKSSWIRPAMKFCRFKQCERLVGMRWDVPRELREEFLGVAEVLSQAQLGGEDDSDVFAQVMRHPGDFKERFYDWLIEELNQPDEVAVRALTELILEERGVQVLGIHEEHRLAQAAIQVRTQLEMSTGGNALERKKNPYIIYQQLKAERERAEVTSFPQVRHQERPFLFCPRKVFEAAVTVVAPEEVLAKCNRRHITKESLQELAGGLRGRISAEIGVAVHDLTGCAIEELNANLQDPFFNILNAPLTEAGVPLNQAMLCVIITSILDQPDEVAEGEVLSPREKGWLSTFSTINGCQQGQVEGVLLVYRSLPVAYQYGVEEGAPAIETARKFARMTLQTAIEQTLSQDNALMKELTGAAVVNQLPHQATYLKNRLGFYLGRQEGVVFDRHTHTLYDRLIDQSSESLVSTFCRHFTVEQAIGSLIQGFDNLSGEPRLQATVYNGVINLFEGKIKPDELFTLDPWALTEEGALALLDSLGIFNELLPAIVEAVDKGENARGMELFVSLPETVKNDIFLAMWQVCGSPLTGDLRYGENGFYGRIEGWSPEDLREKRLLAMRKVLLN